MNQTLYLLSQKAVFWQEKGLLLIADLHVGKITHFRKAGIAVPAQAIHTDYVALEAILHQYPVQEILFLGDLFHSVANQACIEFSGWRSQYPHIRFTLIKGNHDLLPASFYQAMQIQLHPDVLIEPPFILSHIPLTELSDYYNLAGHLHPAVRLVGKGKQVLTLPCFCFGKSAGILPAFGSFTGKAIITPEPQSKVFVVAGTQVSCLK